jgi:hypothetical protein
MSPILPGQSYQLDQPLYDTVAVPVVAKSAQQAAFFSVPLNGTLVSTTTKSRAHTCMSQTGILEKGQSFDAVGMSWFVREMNHTPARPVLVDYISLIGGWFDIQIGGVNYGYFPSAMIPSGGAELSYFSNITAAATEYHMNHGVPATSNIFHFRNPIRITEQESIAVTLNWVDAITVITFVTFAFWGTLTRPVR